MRSPGPTCEGALGGGQHDRTSHNPERPVPFVPVLRNDMCNWTIPRLNEKRLRINEGEELRRLRQQFRGTTPAGRELYRKTLAGIENRLTSGAKVEEVIVYARRQFHSFPSLSSQFKRLFTLDYRQNVNAGSITLDGLAAVLVLRRRAALVLCGDLKPEV